VSAAGGSKKSVVHHPERRPMPPKSQIQASKTRPALYAVRVQVFEASLRLTLAWYRLTR